MNCIVRTTIKQKKIYFQNVSITRNYNGGNTKKQQQLVKTLNVLHYTALPMPTQYTIKQKQLPQNRNSSNTIQTKVQKKNHAHCKQ